MLQVKRLKKVKIIGLQKDKAQVLEDLQHLSVLHLKDISRDTTDDLQADLPLEGLDDIAKHQLTTKFLQESLLPFAKKEANLHNLDLPELNAVMKDAKDMHKQLAIPIKENQEELRVLSTKKNHLAKLSTHPLLQEELPLALFTSRFFTYTSAEQPKSTDHVLAIFKLAEGYLTAHELEKEQAETDVGVTLTPVSLPEDILGMAAEKKLKTTTQLKAHLASFSKELDKKTKSITTDMTHLAKSYPKLQLISTHLDAYRQRHDSSLNFLRTDQLFVMEGYADPSEVKQLQRISPDLIIKVDHVDDEDAPTKLRKLPILGAFGQLIDMFGYPKYRSADPSIPLSLVFPLFFGLMFSDMGYGLLMLLLTGGLFIVYRRNRQPAFRDALVILTICSLTTVVFGALFGSFFGNLFAITPLLLDPLQKTVVLLTTTLAIGVLHINFGLLLNTGHRLQGKDAKGFIGTELPLFAIEAAVVLFFVPTITANVSLIIIALSLLAIIFTKGPFGIMDVVGFAGTLMSYSRLLALALATSGIALAINIISGELAALGVIGAILGVALLIFGHLFNFALNMFGSFVHSLRLHYVEFFSTFYTPGGVAFKPFTLDHFYKPRR